MGDDSLLAPAPLAPLANALRSGELALPDYIERVCDRLDAVDDRVQALLPETNRRARLQHDARSLIQHYPTPESRPPLYGIPVGVKDIFRADGFETHAGSQLPAKLFAGAEAACVQRLKAHGALVLGKTVTTEFAFFEPGLTRNPHNLQHTPGGSSSGSAAAVAAGITPLALGTQTIGSVVRPAAFCGVVGFKPSYGRIDPTGVIFIAPSLDHVGMFTQDIEGMRLAASVLIENWRMVKAKPLEVLGVPEGVYLQQTSAEGLEAFEKQIGRLKQAGYVVKRVPMFENITVLNDQHRALMAGEMAQVHADWFAPYEALYRPRTAAMIRDGQHIDAPRFESIRAMQKKARVDLETLMTQEKIDLWISPSAKGAAPEGITSTGDPAMSFPWTFAGLPTVSIPAGYSAEGLPLGMQCVAAFGQDEVLLAWAQAVETALQA